MVAVINCNPTSVLRVEARSVLVDFKSPEEATEFMQALQDAKLAKSDPVELGRRTRKLLGYDESVTQSLE